MCGITLLSSVVFLSFYFYFIRLYCVRYVVVDFLAPVFVLSIGRLVGIRLVFWYLDTRSLVWTCRFLSFEFFNHPIGFCQRLWFIFNHFYILKNHTISPHSRHTRNPFLWRQNAGKTLCVARLVYTTTDIFLFYFSRYLYQCFIEAETDCLCLLPFCRLLSIFYYIFIFVYADRLSPEVIVIVSRANERSSAAKQFGRIRFCVCYFSFKSWWFHLLQIRIE